jgi:hypothetical protein
MHNLEVRLYNPHQNQKIIHDSINFEPYKYYVLSIGRQFGKTMLGMNQAFYWAMNDSGCKIGWVSPIYKQSEKVCICTDHRNATQPFAAICVMLPTSIKDSRHRASRPVRFPP